MATDSLPKGIRRRGEGYEVSASYRGTRKTGAASSIEEAILLRQQLRADVRGEPVVALPLRKQNAWTLSKAIGITKQMVWKDSDWGLHAAHNAEVFAKYAGRDRPLDTIDFNTLEQWALELEGQGKSDGTINRHLAAVSKVLSVAVERGGLAAKPRVPRRKESEGRIRFLTAEEEAAVLGLFQQWGKADEHDLFVVLVDTGMRMGEALRLEARDIDFKTGVVSIWKTKNSVPRSVPMTKRVRAVLERRAAKVQSVQRVLPVPRHAFRQTWDRAKSLLGLSGDRQFVPHVLRHTCASRLIQRGVALKVVQEWMGHKSISITMRYAHLAPANLMAAVKVLEET